MSITLPDAINVTQLLEMLVGKPSGLVRGGGELDVTQAPAGTYVSFLVDSEGNKVGAIVADLTAALHLGGSMIMLPEGALKEEQARGQAPESVVDAIGEIFNNLRALVNRNDRNPHVTPSDPVLLADTAPGDVARLGEAAKSLTLGGATPFGQGNVVLLSL
ncbi:MAG: 2'-5' RNA ligase family protein [bacterium]|nr:2'-5' RNA ligase family protein [bacterium]